MPQKLLLNKYRGMFTDPVDARTPNNGFRELINWRLTRDKVLEKIPGYMLFTDYLFDSAINNIEQLVRTEDRNIFYFSSNDIYRQSQAGVVSVLKDDYPEIQTGEANNRFSKVRSIPFRNKIYCVDEKLYPFFIYNLSDEAGLNLNVWAELKVGVPPFTSGSSDTLTLVDANDDTITYKTITIPAIENDGSNLVIKYNDGSNIYIFSDTWGYKFNYSILTFDIVKRTNLSTSTITDFSFKDTTFAFWNSASEGKEFDYDFLEKINPENYFWEGGNFRGFNSGSYPQVTASWWNRYGLFGLVMSHFVYKQNSSNEWRFSREVYGSQIRVDARINFAIRNYNGDVVQKSESDVNQTNVMNKSYTETYRSQSGTQKVRVHSKIRFDMNQVDRVVLVFRKESTLYVASWVKMDYSYRRQLRGQYYDGSWNNVYNNDTGDVENQILEAEIIKKYDLNTANLDELAVTETLQDLKDMITNNEYDFLYVNVQDAPTVNDDYLYNEFSLEIPVYFGDGSYTGLEKNVDENFVTTFPLPTYDYAWENQFLFKETKFGQTTPELFYPYVTEYNADDWEVKMMGTPGRPYVIKQSAGNITGDYIFYISYVTSLDSQSETFKSEPYTPPSFVTEKADVYWAFIPADYYGHTFLGLRIYAEDTATGIISLVKEVPEDASSSSEWQEGHAVIDTITPIESFLNVKPYFPKMNINTIHLERYVMSGNIEAPNTYYFSEAGDPTNNPLTNNGTIRAQDKDVIVALGSIFDRMIVWKRQHIYAVVGDLQQPQGTLTISKKFGCIAPDSLIVYKTIAVFLSHAGVLLLDGNNVIEVSRDVINKWIFDNHDITKLQQSFAEFDAERKEYRLYIGKNILIFNLNNDFYLESKMKSSHQQTAVRAISDDNNDRQVLFATTEHQVFEDNKSNHWNGRKRWAYLLTKKYKLSDFENLSLLNLFKVNAELNSPLLFKTDSDAQVIVPDIGTYYEKKLDNVGGETIQFSVYEKSSWDAKISDMELTFEQ